jgi:threonine aldolase
MVLMSKELQQAVRASQGKPVRLADPEKTNVVYVVIPVEIYENMMQGLFYDDNPLTNEEQQNLLFKAGHRAGWDDPEMDIYNDYNDLEPRRPL